MTSETRVWMMLLATSALLLGAPTVAHAQDDDSSEPEPAASAEGSEPSGADEANEGEEGGDDDDDEELKELEEEIEEEKTAEEAGDQAEEVEAPEEEKRESAHGSYEFKRSFGGGVELGLFFTPLERWNALLLEPNNAATFDTDVVLNFDLAFEITPIEGLRISAFGGIQGPGTDNPGLSALYFGLEPVLAYRRGRWEFGVGGAVGTGRLDLTLDSGASARTGLVLLRPFLEARTYATDFAAAFARLGFNYWLVHSPEFDGLDNTQTLPNNPDNSTNLSEGGLYLSVGLRFGSYPEPIKNVPDSDEDGLRDDVDDCPDEPEDPDEFEDNDGCPDLDNDDDGVQDEQDNCPLEPEDVDGFQDEDGCPDPDNDGDEILDVDDKCPDEAGIPEKDGCPIRDKDSDGVLDDVDKCPTEPEDKDGYMDADGCPDPDNDGDGILDVDDKCPDEPELVNGIEDEDGCPEADSDNDGIIDQKDDCPDEAETYNGNKDEDGCPDGKQTVVITETEIKILEKVFFATGKATIQSRSHKLLDTVATALKQNPQVTKIRVEGHTDDVGDEADNMQLSKERAEAVRTYMIEEDGVAPDRLKAQGFGESKPLCDDIDELLEKPAANKQAIEECRSQNRRVQFRIVELNGKPVEATDSVKIKEEKVIEEPIEDAEEAGEATE